MERTQLNLLDEVDKVGLDSVTYDPDWKVLEYVYRVVHIQPGGYVHTPLADL